MARSSDISDEIHERLYRALLLIRRSEELLMAEYHPADEMRCPIHFCVGQEATPAALSLILRTNDVLMAHHRNHGYYIAKGAPLAAMVAEFYGKKTGANGGLAGSQELSFNPVHFYSGAILSGTFAIANGAAFSQKYLGSDNVTVAVIGDGGMDEGVVYEALNLAAIKKLPILFICENNLYSAHSRIDNRSISQTLADRAAPFGIHTLGLDGHDPIPLYRSLSNVVGQIRCGLGPVFIEIFTYRFCGHVGPESDDHIGYRTADEVEAWKKRDPVTTMRQTLINAGFETTKIDQIDNDIDDEILAAIALAKQAPFPDLSEALAMNISGSHDSVIDRFAAPQRSSFDGAQAEARLTPY